MKIQIKIVSLAAFLVISFFSQGVYGRQVVTKELRDWAKKVISQEKELKALSAQNSVAVLYFLNKTNDQELNPLQKGIAIMLITDLSKIDGLDVVERVKLQALMEELNLSISGLTKSDTAPRIGKLLGATWIVGGDVQGTKDKLKLTSNVLKVVKQAILGRPFSQGKLSTIFDMEKTLLFEIIKLLKVKISKEKLEELKRPLSTNVDALMAFFRGIEASDQRKYELAARYYQEAIKKDKNLKIAKDALLELKSLGLIKTSKRTKRLLKSIRTQTSLTDRLTPKYPVKRLRTPAEVQSVGGERAIPPNLPPDFGATTEPPRPTTQPGSRPQVF